MQGFINGRYCRSCFSVVVRGYELASAMIVMSTLLSFGSMALNLTAAGR